jgi:hypothetical protein
MAKPRLSLAHRILFLREELERFRAEEREAGITMMASTEAYKAVVNTATDVDLAVALRKMTKDHAVYGYILHQINGIKERIRVLETKP